MTFSAIYSSLTHLSLATGVFIGSAMASIAAISGYLLGTMPGRLLTKGLANLASLPRKNAFEEGYAKQLRDEAQKKVDSIKKQQIEFKKDIRISWRFKMWMAREVKKYQRELDKLERRLKKIKSQSERTGKLTSKAEAIVLSILKSRLQTIIEDIKRRAKKNLEKLERRPEPTFASRKELENLNRFLSDLEEDFEDSLSSNTSIFCLVNIILLIEHPNLAQKRMRDALRKFALDLTEEIKEIESQLASRDATKEQIERKNKIFNAARAIRNKIFKGILTNFIEDRSFDITHIPKSLERQIIALLEFFKAARNPSPEDFDADIRLGKLEGILKGRHESGNNGTVVATILTTGTWKPFARQIHVPAP